MGVSGSMGLLPMAEPPQGGTCLCQLATALPMQILKLISVIPCLQFLENLWPSFKLGMLSHCPWGGGECKDGVGARLGSQDGIRATGVTIQG